MGGNKKALQSLIKRLKKLVNKENRALRKSSRRSLRRFSSVSSSSNSIALPILNASPVLTNTSAILNQFSHTEQKSIMRDLSSIIWNLTNRQPAYKNAEKHSVTPEEAQSEENENSSRTTSNDSASIDFSEFSFDDDEFDDFSDSDNTENDSNTDNSDGNSERDNTESGNTKKTSIEFNPSKLPTYANLFGLIESTLKNGKTITSIQFKNKRNKSVEIPISSVDIPGKAEKDYQIDTTAFINALSERKNFSQLVINTNDGELSYTLQGFKKLTKRDVKAISDSFLYESEYTDENPIDDVNNDHYDIPNINNGVTLLSFLNYLKRSAIKSGDIEIYSMKDIDDATYEIVRNEDFSNIHFASKDKSCIASISGIKSLISKITSVNETETIISLVNTSEDSEALVENLHMDSSINKNTALARKEKTLKRALGGAIGGLAISVTALACLLIPGSEYFSTAEENMTKVESTTAEENITNDESITDEDSLKNYWESLNSGSTSGNSTGESTTNANTNQSGEMEVVEVRDFPTYINYMHSEFSTLLQHFTDPEKATKLIHDLYCQAYCECCETDKVPDKKPNTPPAINNSQSGNESGNESGDESGDESENESGNESGDQSGNQSGNQQKDPVVDNAGDNLDDIENNDGKVPGADNQDKEITPPTGNDQGQGGGQNGSGNGLGNIGNNNGKVPDADNQDEEIAPPTGNDQGQVENVVDGFGDDLDKVDPNKGVTSETEKGTNATESTFDNILGNLETNNNNTNNNNTNNNQGSVDEATNPGEDSNSQKPNNDAIVNSGSSVGVVPEAGANTAEGVETGSQTFITPPVINSESLIDQKTENNGEGLGVSNPNGAAYTIQLGGDSAVEAVLHPEQEVVKVVEIENVIGAEIEEQKEIKSIFTAEPPTGDTFGDIFQIIEYEDGSKETYVNGVLIHSEAPAPKAEEQSATKTSDNPTDTVVDLNTNDLGVARDSKGLGE